MRSLPPPLYWENAVANYPFTPTVAGLSISVPFIGPEALERTRGVRIRARLGANESVFGPSLQAIAAMRQAAAESWKYGDPENHDLKQALAARHGVKPDNIVIGEGIDGLHNMTVRLFVEPGVTVATSLGAYPTFNFHVAGYGGRLVTVPYRNDREDPAALIDVAKREQARLIFFANPDNPMGTWWDAGTVKHLIESVPDGAVLCLDEAYSDFAPESAELPMDVSNPKLLRFRTFSKAHGMAGARIGYAIGEAGLVRQFDAIRNHFGITRMAQAGALASLGDPEHLAFVIGQVREARDRLGAIAASHGFQALPSATNFVAIDCGRDGAYAKSIVDGLVARGIFVRMPGVAPLNRCIRVSAGTAEDLDAFEEVLGVIVRK